MAMQREDLKRILKMHGYNQSKAAKFLGCTKQNVDYHLKREKLKVKKIGYDILEDSTF